MGFEKVPGQESAEYKQASVAAKCYKDN